MSLVKTKLIRKILALAFNALENMRWQNTYNNYRKKYSIDSTFYFNGNGILLYGDGQIILGANSRIGRYSSIQASKGLTVKIGNKCAISHFVMIYTQNLKSTQDFSTSHTLSIGNVIVGDYCWIGAHVFIKEGVTIGNNVVVGANSVVTKDIPSFTVVAGTPAKIIKKIER